MTADADTLIATVREAQAFIGSVIRSGESYTRAVEEAELKGKAALDSLAAELERVTKQRDACMEMAAAERPPDAAFDAALRAELERVKAERDADMSALHDVTEATGVRLVQARLDKALSALRETRDELNTWLPSESSERLRKRIDAAIAEALK